MSFVRHRIKFALTPTAFATILAIGCAQTPSKKAAAAPPQVTQGLDAALNPAATLSSRKPSCALTMQQKFALAATLPDAQLGGIDAGLSRIAAVTGDPAAVQDASYQLMTSETGAVFGYDLIKYFKSKDGTWARLEWGLSDASDAENHAATYYSLVATAYLAVAGEIVHTTAEAYHVDKSSCVPSPATIYVADVSGSNATVQEKDLIEGTPTNSNGAVDVAGLKGDATSLLSLDHDDYTLGTAFSYYDLLGQSPSVLSMTAKAGETDRDLVKGADAPFNVEQVITSQNGIQASAMVCRISTASTYRTCTTTSAGSATTMTRVNDAIWLGNDIAAGAVESYGATANGFTAADINGADLRYTVETDAPLTFDNYAAYFNMTAAPAPTDGHRAAYVVDNPQPSAALDAFNNPFVAGAGGGTGGYLKETTYLNFSDPSVRRLATQAAQQAGAGPTQAALVNAILNVVGAAVKYDTKAEQTEDISTESASAIIAAGKGVCQHFAAVFVAVARANGLPARMVEGMDIATDQQSGVSFAAAHEWIEVLLDGRTWVPLDPQVTQSLALADRSYFPIAVDKSYETPLGQADDPNAASVFNADIVGMVLTETSATPAAGLALAAVQRPRISPFAARPHHRPHAP